MDGIRRFRLLALAAALIGALFTPAPAQAAATPRVGPAGDAFYQPPRPLPPGRPGDVIWYRPVDVTSLRGFPAGSLDRAYRILYRSTDARGAAIAVSGTVLIPTDRAEGSPLVGYAPGTQGVADSCAPSRRITTDLGADQAFLNALVTQGMAVAMTDYEGLGTPGVHTYVVGRSEAHTVTDAVRAALRLAPAGLPAHPRVAFAGYSQGGGAAAWAAQTQPRYAPELRLVGVAAGGIPADLTAVAAHLEGGLGFGLLGAAATGLDTAYPELDLDAYLNPAGRTWIADAQSLCAADLVLRYAGHHISEYTVGDPLHRPDWVARLDQQTLGRTPPRVPVYSWHSVIDELVDFGQAATLRATYCAAGVRETWRTYPAGHVLGLLAGAPDATRWLADRLAGKPAPSNCEQ